MSGEVDMVRALRERICSHGKAPGAKLPSLGDVERHFVGYERLLPENIRNAARTVERFHAFII